MTVANAEPKSTLPKIAPHRKAGSTLPVVIAASTSGISLARTLPRHSSPTPRTISPRTTITAAR